MLYNRTTIKWTIWDTETQYILGRVVREHVIYLIFLSFFQFLLRRKSWCAQRKRRWIFPKERSVKNPAHLPNRVSEVVSTLSRQLAIIRQGLVRMTFMFFKNVCTALYSDCKKHLRGRRIVEVTAKNTNKYAKVEPGVGSLI